MERLAVSYEVYREAQTMISYERKRALKAKAKDMGGPSAYSIDSQLQESSKLLTI